MYKNNFNAQILLGHYVLSQIDEQTSQAPVIRGVDHIAFKTDSFLTDFRQLSDRFMKLAGHTLTLSTE